MEFSTKSIVHSQIEEELKDCLMYEDLAKEFEDEGHDGFAAIVRDIANEERTHSNYMQYIYNKLEEE